MKLLRPVRTRFAPSPTGHLHLGSARTALFNYLFATHHQGKLIVRFEDTDQKRNVTGAIAAQLASLRWLGLNIAETIDQPDTKYSPYLQSERLALYRQYAQWLVKHQQAYHCFCTSSELARQKALQLQQGQKAFFYDRRCLKLLTSTEVKRRLRANVPHCIRMQVTATGLLQFTDLTFGKMEFQANAVEDFVLLKSDGYPTYNFAVVIDDYLMQISHVLRGLDHLSNTAKQILLYQAFNWPTPQFAHFTLLQIDQQRKLSKRTLQPEHDLSYYQQIGILPVAMRNFLALLGWTPPANQEFLTDSALIKHFDGTNFNRSPSILDLNKLYWLNHKHLQQLSVAQFWQLCQPFLTNTLVNLYPLAICQKLVQLYQSEVMVVQDIQRLTAWFWPQLPQLTTIQQQQLITSQAVLKTVYQLLNCQTDWTSTSLRATLKQLKATYQQSTASLYQPLRLALTGQTFGPPLVQIMLLLTKPRCLARLVRIWE